MNATKHEVLQSNYLETSYFHDNVDSSEYIIEVKNLEKYFNGFKAVDGINFKIRKGELFSLLGPNGAGKSTTIRMLTTVLKPTSGDARISEYSLKREKNNIKSLIGVCPQENIVFDALTAEDNVEFVGRMHGMSADDVKERSKVLLEKMNIAGRKKPAKTFSGGMKRRLSLAMSLVHQPEILFLDEPTAGLDPQARRIVWDFIHELKTTGMTIILTTHDMAEADALSDHLAIIDHGKVIACGTVDDIKRSSDNGNVIEISFFSREELIKAKQQLEHVDSVKQIICGENNKLTISFAGGAKGFKRDILNRLESFKTLHFREDSLEEIFLKLTGRELREN
ncbi:MAG: daunorubicin resistance ABC transporter ATPase subunit [Promethearchaeota archaeon CR_4]|nr:MAG: daunorubicin resistance ABC transporter ATPase subunit [Candidatus Lokiarchaeota archaeon CR_4]